MSSRLYEKYRDRTMTNEATFEANLRLVDRMRDVPGAVVECGVWRGGMIAAIAEVLGPQRHYALFDSFQGLPPAQPVDGRAAIAWQAANPSNCAATIEDARSTMLMSGAPFEVFAGWFWDTIAGDYRGPGDIAVLRLDADWHASTLRCLENLFGLVRVGGIVILDDYYVWEGCAQAVHEFLGRDWVTVSRIRELDGVAYIVKEGREC